MKSRTEQGKRLNWIYLKESIEEANAYIPPSWFTKDVTMDAAYHNSNMSKKVVTKP